jgi:hypothetical protein
VMMLVVMMREVEAVLTSSSLSNTLVETCIEAQGTSTRLVCDCLDTLPRVLLMLHRPKPYTQIALSSNGTFYMSQRRMKITNLIDVIGQHTHER